MNWAARTMLAAICVAVVPAPASAATIIILTDPMTLDRRTVVLDTPGRDRFLLCSMPPAVAGCREVPMPRQGKR